MRNIWPMRGGGPKKAPKSGKQRQARAEEDKAQKKSQNVQAFVQTVENQAKIIVHDRVKTKDKTPALLCAHPSPRSLKANKRDDNDSLSSSL